MTKGLKHTIVEYACGNIRLLNNISSELLTEGARRELKQLDETLYLELFSAPRQ
jgi:hypothetical protein